MRHARPNGRHADDRHPWYPNKTCAVRLSQRLDHFDGLAVLATNLGHNIDPAFVRRMDFVVDFPMPDLASRRAMSPGSRTNRTVLTPRPATPVSRGSIDLTRLVVHGAHIQIECRAFPRWPAKVW